MTNDDKLHRMALAVKRWKRTADELDAAGYAETAAALRVAARLHHAKATTGAPRDDMGAEADD